MMHAKPAFWCTIIAIFNLTVTLNRDVVKFRDGARDRQSEWYSGQIDNATSKNFRHHQDEFSIQPAQSGGRILRLLRVREPLCGTCGGYSQVSPKLYTASHIQILFELYLCLQASSASGCFRHCRPAHLLRGDGQRHLDPLQVGHNGVP